MVFVENKRSVHTARVFSVFNRNQFNAPSDFMTEHLGLREAIGRLPRRASDPLANVLIIGPPGSGRATLARHVWKRLGNPQRAFIHIHAGSLIHQRHLVYLLQSVGSADIYLAQIDGAFVHMLSKHPRSLCCGKVRFIASVDDQSDLPQAAMDFFPRSIEVPPLRQRFRDIPLIIRSRFQITRYLQFHSDALRKLQVYPWPGEVPQLLLCSAQLINRALECGKREIREEDVGTVLAETGFLMEPLANIGQLTELQWIYEYAQENGFKPALQFLEAMVIFRCYRECSGSLSFAARRLKMPVSTLESRLKALRTQVDALARIF